MNADSPAGDAKQSARHPGRRVLVAVVMIGGLVGAAWYVFLHEENAGTHLVLQGNIDVRQVNLSFKVDGRIETLAVDEGDTVKAGQVVATLDKRYFEDELRVARALRDNLAASLAKLEHGSRPEEIAEARAQTAAREATLAAGQGRLRAVQGAGKDSRGGQQAGPRQVRRSTGDGRGGRQVRARVAATDRDRPAQRGHRRRPRTARPGGRRVIIQIERKLADSNLVAPNDGFILTRSREIGAIVQAGETVFTLTLTSPVWVRTYVNERDLGFVRPGMPASVTTDTAPDRPYSGPVGFISPTAEFTPKTVETREIRTNLVYRLRVVVDNPDGGLRQGMPVTVKTRLPQPRQHDALAAPAWREAEP